MNELSKHEQKKLAKLNALRTRYELSKDDVLVDITGGAIGELEWVGVSVTLQNGKADSEAYAKAAKALATVLPYQVLTQAVEISESMKERGHTPFAAFPSDWMERMMMPLVDGTAEDPVLF